MSEYIPQEVPQDIMRHIGEDAAQRLVEAVNNIRDILDELRPLLPAIRVENEALTDKVDHLADIDIVHTSLGTGEVKRAYLVQYGESKLLSRPVVAYMLETPLESKSEPGAGEPLSTKLPGSSRPPTIGTNQQIVGDIIQIRIAKKVKPGTRVYIKLDNLLEDPLHIIQAVPDNFPWWGNGKTRGLLDAATRVHRDTHVKPRGQLTTSLTQPLSEADSEQLILLYEGKIGLRMYSQFSIPPIG
jgi:hypothetical protein